MVTRFSMESQDKRMCKTESVLSVGTVDYNTHHAYDEDCFGDILNILDFPMESLEGDGFAEDWASKLGPIPSEVFKEVIPPPGPQIGAGNNFGSYTDLPFDYPVPVTYNKTCQQKYHDEEIYKNYEDVVNSQLKQQTVSVEERKLYPAQAPFEAPSPNSVLESRTSSSSNKGISFGTEISIPVRTRTKRLRPTTNPWLMSYFMGLPNKHQKRRSPPVETKRFIDVRVETKRFIDVRVGTKRFIDVRGIKKCAHCEITETPQWREGPLGPKTLCNVCGVPHQKRRSLPVETKRFIDVREIKKCAHCEITETPQWREGPLGPKTLCNACGVRYRSGRLYPEYRPALSPTFVPALHSNSHRKVIEMRQKAVN